MRRYIDTSVLTSAYCDEPASDRAQEALQECEPEICGLTRLEFSSAVAKKLRMGTFHPSEATRVINLFHEHIRAHIFIMTAIKESDYALANQWIDSFATPLRTMDALHLAVAASNELPIVTADAVMAKSAATLGLKVIRL